MPVRTQQLRNKTNYEHKYTENYF